MRTRRFLAPLLACALAAAAHAAPDRALRGTSPEYRKAIATIESLARAKQPSMSTGSVSHGGIKNAAELPKQGTGYRLAAPERKTHFGTDEMVFGIIELAAYIQERRPGSPWLSIGDIAQQEGGKLAPHLNHQDGRDVDIAFQYCSAKGEPVDKHWLKCNDEGGTSNPQAFFDAARNFDFLCLWLESPYFGGCEWIFVHEPLKKILIAHGRELAKKTPRAADQIEKWTSELEKLLREPTSSPHDDHFHLRLRHAPAH